MISTSRSAYGCLATSFIGEDGFPPAAPPGMRTGQNGREKIATFKTNYQDPAGLQASITVAHVPEGDTQPRGRYMTVPVLRLRPVSEDEAFEHTQQLRQTVQAVKEVKEERDALGDEGESVPVTRTPEYIAQKAKELMQAGDYGHELPAVNDIIEPPPRRRGSGKEKALMQKRNREQLGLGTSVEFVRCFKGDTEYPCNGCRKGEQDDWDISFFSMGSTLGGDPVFGPYFFARHLLLPAYRAVRHGSSSPSGDLAAASSCHRTCGFGYEFL